MHTTTSCQAYHSSITQIKFTNIWPPSPATPEGRMKKPKSGIRSTRKKHNSGGASRLGMEITDSDSETENENTPKMPTPDIIPNDGPQTNNIFFYASLAEKQEGTLYTDATGAFSEMSLASVYSVPSCFSANAA